MPRASTAEYSIYRWDEIQKEFSGSDILLGNGFSINLTDRFHYKSLFEEFLKSCTPTDCKAFGAFGTANFERILESFSSALQVNTILSLPTKPLLEASERIRSGLITTVQANHPWSHEINWDRLKRVSEQLDEFGDIYTLNYDALLYHIIMIAKDRHQADKRVRPYNDYYWNAVDDQFLQFMDYQNYSVYKHVYYLHGAIFLFRYGYMDVKLRRAGGGELLNEVARAIRAKNIPLFVSEGVPADKLLAISRSDYLRFALDALKEPKKSLVIYGASLSAPDHHVTEAIRKSTGRLAISIHSGGRAPNDIQAEMHAFMSKFAGSVVAFFDSQTLFG